jgi:long-chain acyl-CoA synthetase
MYVLYERDVNKDIDLLWRSWGSPETFAFVPDKGGISEQWIEQSLEKLPVEYQHDHFALLTSGSTGHPKMVIGQRRRSERLAQVLHTIQEGEDVEQTIQILPLTYCYAFVNQWLWAMVHKRKLVPTKGLSDPADIEKKLAQARNAMLCMVGAQVSLFCHYFSQRSFSQVIRLHFAGGRFPQERLEDLRKLFPNALIFNNYGCAEALPRLTLRKANEASLAEDIGRALPGIELKVNSVNELQFRSPYAEIGEVKEGIFYPADDRTWIMTGDLARKNDNGNWELLGRANQIFKRYGEKISLLNLQKLTASILSAEAAFYFETDSLGEKGHILVLSPPPSDEDVKRLLLEFRRQFPRTHWPLRIEGTQTMPLLPNGKIEILALSNLDDVTVYWRQRI